MYGQTGSGKTYTMAGIERYAAAALARPRRRVAAVGGRRRSRPPSPLRARRLTLHRPLVRRAAVSSTSKWTLGAVQPVGAPSLSRSTRRRSSSTSSRRRRGAAPPTPPAPTPSRRGARRREADAPRQGAARRTRGGCTLVDCAGSGAQGRLGASAPPNARNEACAINCDPLHALKECIRYGRCSLAGEKVQGAVPPLVAHGVLATSFFDAGLHRASVRQLPSSAPHSPSSTDTDPLSVDAQDDLRPWRPRGGDARR